MLQAPSELYIPGTSDASAASSDPSQWIAYIAMVVITIGLGWFAFHVIRNRGVHPDEHAFRSLARRLRLNRSEIDAVRTFARTSNGRKPIEVLMNQSLLEQAISGCRV